MTVSLRRPVRSQRRLFASATILRWLSLINFLAVRNINVRFKRTPVAAILALASPLLVLAAFTILRGVLKGRYPQYGSSLVVFFASGVFPYFVFMRMALAARQVSYHPARRWPGLTSTDTLVAAWVTDSALILTSMVMCFYGLWLYGLVEAKPVDAMACLYSLFFLAIFGGGLGLINMAIARHFKLWGFAYANLTRGMLFLSGVFHVVDLTPLFIRNILVWNPIVHGIEWFRLGLYGTYPIHTLDRAYLIECAALTMFLGLVVHTATLRMTGR